MTLLPAKPLLITLGDPAGVGPEVAAKVLAEYADLNAEAGVPWVVVGPQWALQMGAEIARVQLPEMAQGLVREGLGLIDIDVPRAADFALGQVQAECGRAAVESVEYAARACIDGRAAAMVTCPLNKEAIHAAGYVNDLGHQEILARLTGAQWTATMLMTPGLKVAHLSTHKSIIEAAKYVTRATILEKLNLIQQAVVSWGIKQPRIAVAALNPHGGEGGLLGREEIEEIAPGVIEAQGQGIDVQGPIPADSIFNRAIAGEFDIVLALYHDQGHIAIKVHNFHESTTATLGIPFVRTSVDHGTAFDIAGQGIANPQGLKAAITTAQHIVAGTLA